MGKDSLIKSTDKKASGTKKAAQKTKPKATKKAEAKTPKTATKKTAAKKTAAPKSSTPKKQSPPQKKAKVKAVSIKDLVLKKFEPLQAPAPAGKPKKPAKLPDAPPLISTTDSKEAARLRKLLLATHSMKDVKAAAKPPEPAKSAPAVKPEDKPSAKPKETSAAHPASEPMEEAQPVVTTASDDYSEESPDPMKKVIKYAVAGFALVLFLIIGTSAKNSAKYYVETKQGALEIWRGNFSPTGKSLFITLPGVQAPQDEKAVYTREEVYPLAFNYYLDKADSLLDVPGLPDYEKIKEEVRRASAFAVTSEMTQAVDTRLNTIDRMALLYKADVAASKGTEASLDTAVKDLQAAKRLTSDPALLAGIDQKIEAARQAKAALAAKPGEQE